MGKAMQQKWRERWRKCSITAWSVAMILNLVVAIVFCCDSEYRWMTFLFIAQAIIAATNLREAVRAI